MKERQFLAIRETHPYPSVFLKDDMWSEGIHVARAGSGLERSFGGRVARAACPGLGTEPAAAARDCRPRRPAGLGRKNLAGLVAKPLKRLKTGKEREGKSPSQDHSRTRFGPKREGFGRLKGRSCGPKPPASPSPRAVMPVRTDVRLVPSYRIR